MDLQAEWAKRERTLEAEVLGDQRLGTKNRTYIEQHLTHLRAESLDVRSVIRHLYGLKKLLEASDYPKDLHKLTRQDIEKAVARVNAQNYSDETRLHFFGVWKSFYKWSMGEGLYYPPCVVWLKLTNKNKKKLLPEDILERADINKMLNATTSLRDKLFIYLLFETGCRISELLYLRKKDCKLDTQPPRIFVTGKTGFRPIQIIETATLLGNYFIVHSELSDNDIIWKNESANCDPKSNMSYQAARFLLRDAAGRAGITKPVNPHALRKARATELAGVLSDQQLKKRFGWIPGSDVVGHYIAISGKASDDAYMKAYGMKVEDSNKPVMQIKECPRCKYPNGNVSFCGRCGSALTIDVAEQQAEDMQNVSSILTESIKNGNINESIEALSRLILKMDAEKKKGRR